MSSFEFLSVLLSVVVGLGMANMLTGVGRLLHMRRSIRFSVAHLMWSLFVFVMMVVFWWTVVFGYRDWEDWNILLFVFILMYGMFLFLLSAILYPTEIPQSWDLFEHFIDMRRWFFGVYILWLLSEFTDSYLKDHLGDFALPYALLVGSWCITVLWGWISTNRKIHTFIATYQLISLLIWIGYQLEDLEWSFAQAG